MPKLKESDLERILDDINPRDRGAVNIRLASALYSKIRDYLRDEYQPAPVDRDEENSCYGA